MEPLTISEVIMFTMGAMNSKHKLEIDADSAIEFAGEVEKKLFELEIEKAKNKPIIEPIAEAKIITLTKN